MAYTHSCLGSKHPITKMVCNWFALSVKFTVWNYLHFVLFASLSFCSNLGFQVTEKTPVVKDSDPRLP